MSQLECLNAGSVPAPVGFTRFVAFLVVLISAPSGHAGAQTSVLEPRALVHSFYAADFDEGTMMPLSRRLEALRERAEAKSQEFKMTVSGLMHEWVSGLQDPDERPVDGWQKSVRVVEKARALHRATVIATVSVRSDKRDQQEVHYLLIQESGRWVVDDIHYLTGGEKLSEMLEAGADGARN